MQRPTLPPTVFPPSLAALAEQLQRFRELQTQLVELAVQVAAGPTSRIEDLERLVRLSVAAMGHFNAFTRGLTGVLRELTDAHRNIH
jgi:hypothetical protein